MKNHSFYQFILTVRGRKDAKGELAEEIFDDLSFPKQENCFGLISIWCVDNTYRPPVVRNRELK